MLKSSSSTFKIIVAISVAVCGSSAFASNAPQTIPAHKALTKAPVQKVLPKQAVAKQPSELQQQQSAALVKKMDDISIQLKNIDMQMQLTKARIDLITSEKQLAKLTHYSMMPSFMTKKVVHNPLQETKLQFIYAKDHTLNAKLSYQGLSYQLKQGDMMGNLNLKLTKLTPQQATLTDVKNKSTRILSVNNMSRI